MAEQNNNTVIYFGEYRIYKPNKSNNGAATKIQGKIKNTPYREVQLFWEASQQIGMDGDNAKFGWDDDEKKVVFKMDTPDIGEILAVLNYEKDNAGPKGKDGKYNGIFHQNPRGNTVLQFARLRKEDEPHTYWVKLTSKKGGKLVEVKHVITPAEAQILKVLLEKSVELIYNWQ